MRDCRERIYPFHGMHKCIPYIQKMLDDNGFSLPSAIMMRNDYYKLAHAMR